MSRSTTTWRVLVVGGHTRNIGKTSLVVDLVRAFPEARWKAVKITQYGHGVCARNGENCGCAPDEHSVALDWETDSASGTDTSRFLAAGASRAIWLRTKQGRLAEGLPLLRSALDEGVKLETPACGNLILESNSLMQFLKPALYLAVLDPAQADFKDSARFYLDRADAFLLRWHSGSGALPTRESGRWPDVSMAALLSRPHFVQALGGVLPPELKQFVADRFFAAEPVAI